MILRRLVVVFCLCTIACRDQPTTVAGRSLDPLSGTQPATVLLFVGTACPISNRYVPEINRLYDAYRSKGVAMHLVYADPSVTAADVLEHRRTHALEVPALLDPAQVLVRSTGVARTPEVVVFDDEDRRVYRGRIDDRFVTFTKPRQRVTRHELRDALDAVLAGRPITVSTTTVAGCRIPRAG